MERVLFIGVLLFFSHSATAQQTFAYPRTYPKDYSQPKSPKPYQNVIPNQEIPRLNNPVTPPTSVPPFAPLAPIPRRPRPQDNFNDGLVPVKPPTQPRPVDPYQPVVRPRPDRAPLAGPLVPISRDPYTKDDCPPAETYDWSKGPPEPQADPNMNGPIRPRNQPTQPQQQAPQTFQPPKPFVPPVEPKNKMYEFSATWCGPCRQMEPSVNALIGAGYPIQKVDVDQDRALTAQYSVSSLPCCIAVAPDGTVVDKTEGYQSPQQLQDFMSRNGIRRR